MFLSVSGNRSEQSTAHGQTDLRITNHRVRTNQHAGITWHIIQSEMRPRYYARCEMKFTLHAQKLRSVQRAEYKAFSADNTEKQNQSVNKKKQEMDPDKQCAWSTISLYWTTCYLDLSVI